MNKGRPKYRQILKRWRTSCIAKSLNPKLHNFFIAAYTVKAIKGGWGESGGEGGGGKKQTGIQTDEQRQT